MNSHNTNFDIIVIGAGAVGSGIALDAVLRDYKVIVLEKNDFASGASSKSSKLVHGGVRYLEKAIKNLDKSQLNLVKEALAERAIFLENASIFLNKITINIPIFSYFNLDYYYLNYYNQRNSNSYSFKFNEIEKQVNPNYTYDQREKIIADKQANKNNNLRIAITNLQKQIGRIKKSSLREILSEGKIKINCTDDFFRGGNLKWRLFIRY